MGRLGEDWLEQAVAYTASPAKASAAAHPHSPPSGPIPASDLYGDRDEQWLAVSIAGMPLYRLRLPRQHGRRHRNDRSPRPTSGLPRQITHSPPDQAAPVMPATTAACTVMPPRLYKTAARGKPSCFSYLSTPRTFFTSTPALSAGS